MLSLLFPPRGDQHSTHTGSLVQAGSREEQPRLPAREGTPTGVSTWSGPSLEGGGLTTLTGSRAGRPASPLPVRCQHGGSGPWADGRSALLSWHKHPSTAGITFEDSLSGPKVQD
ncbi:Dermatan-Sulfate Epimerase-Like Protein [Manis pentadactyla]|nr:Dermatan-Sulfate Epimerase-Like Protein [Manis pentadactyla]